MYGEQEDYDTTLDADSSEQLAEDGELPVPHGAPGMAQVTPWFRGCHCSAGNPMQQACAWGGHSSSIWFVQASGSPGERYLSVLCPHHCALSLQPSSATSPWRRGAASGTHCAGTTTKEPPSAGPSSTAAARAISTASAARRSVSSTAGSAWRQVGTARLSALAASHLVPCLVPPHLLAQVLAAGKDGGRRRSVVIPAGTWCYF